MIFFTKEKNKSKLHYSVNYKNLNFKYVDPKKNDVSFYEYRDSKELFNLDFKLDLMKQ